MAEIPGRQPAIRTWLPSSAGHPRIEEVAMTALRMQFLFMTESSSREFPDRPSHSALVPVPARGYVLVRWDFRHLPGAAALEENGVQVEHARAQSRWFISRASARPLRPSPASSPAAWDSGRECHSPRPSRTHPPCSSRFARLASYASGSKESPTHSSMSACAGCFGSASTSRKW